MHVSSRPGICTLRGNGSPHFYRRAPAENFRFDQ
jgi:hypothetical protein